MSYATTAEMLNRYDVNRIGQLVNDSNIKVSATELLGNGILQAMLDDAHGLINTKMMAGRRYSEADLLLLIATGPSTASGPLIRLCCDLAFGMLMFRRGFKAQEVADLVPTYTEALRMLEALRTGQEVFNLSSITTDGNNPPGDAGVNIETYDTANHDPSTFRRPISHNHRLFGRRHLSP